MSRRFPAGLCDFPRWRQILHAAQQSCQVFVSARRRFAEVVGARLWGFVKIGSNNFFDFMAAYFSAALLAITAGIALESIDGISQRPEY